MDDRVEDNLQAATGLMLLMLAAALSDALHRSTAHQSRPSYKPSPRMATAPCTCHFLFLSSDMPSASQTWAVSMACFCSSSSSVMFKPACHATASHQSWPKPRTMSCLFANTRMALWRMSWSSTMACAHTAGIRA